MRIKIFKLASVLMLVNFTLPVSNLAYADPNSGSDISNSELAEPVDAPAFQDHSVANIELIEDTLANDTTNVADSSVESENQIPLDNSDELKVEETPKEILAFDDSALEASF